jgi:hypothetical protein
MPIALTPPIRLRFFPAFAALAAVFCLVAVPAPSAAAADPITVGVVDSASSKAFSAGNPPHPYAQGTDVAGREQAARTWVTNSGHTLVTLSDADLANPAALAAIDVVILPYTWAINESASLTLRSWIKQGGALIPILASPRVFLEGNQWKLWVRALNYEAWEWGPLSEAYQMMFMNDPSPTSWQAKLKAGHPIVNNALGSLGLSAATFTRPTASGVEFGYKYNSNVTSILDFQAVASPYSGFNGYSAAQAVHYGAGRIVYFDFAMLDFLPYYNPVLAGASIGGGHDQGDLADELLGAAVQWAVNGGGFGSVVPSAKTYGEVDAYGTAIYVRQWVTADGTAPVQGQLTMKIYDPSGNLVSEHNKNDLGIEPGRTHMYNWSYIKGSTLSSGTYRVVLEYTFTYPDYSLSSKAQAFVVKGQGKGTKTVPIPVENNSVVVTGDFDDSGTTDVGLFGPSDGVWWVLDASSGSFTPQLWADFSTVSGWVGRLAGDFSGDGKDDIAQFHPSNGTWWVSKSTGSAFSTGVWADFSTASGWTERMAGDYNGDNKTDIAQYHPSNGTWWISKSSGSSFSTGVWADFSTASGWQAHLTGDFNGDGKDDIAQYHPSNGTWWVSRSTGTGFTTELWADFTTTSGWTNRMVGDFNGDGKTDIAQYHPGNGTWWVSRSTGTGFTTELWADFTTTTGWEARMAGDYNGDGKTDIAQYHPGNGTWWVSTSTGTGFTTGLWADYTTTTGWTNRHTGDYNGDGKDDIAQYYPANGTWWVSTSNTANFTTTKWATFAP